MIAQIIFQILTFLFYQRGKVFPRGCGGHGWPEPEVSTSVYHCAPVPTSVLEREKCYHGREEQRMDDELELRWCFEAQWLSRFSCISKLTSVHVPAASNYRRVHDCLHSGPGYWFH